MSKTYTTEEKRRILAEVAEGKNPEELLSNDMEAGTIWLCNRSTGLNEGMVNGKLYRLTDAQLEKYSATRKGFMMVIKKKYKPDIHLIMPPDPEEDEPQPVQATPEPIPAPTKELPEPVKEPAKQSDLEKEVAKIEKEGIPLMGVIGRGQKHKNEIIEDIPWEDIPTENMIGYMFPRR